MWLSTLPAQKRACLECGAGNAELAISLASSFDKSYALDLVERQIPRIENLEFIQGDANKISFEKQSLDLILSMQSLHHFDVEEHLSSAHLALANGGVFASLCWGEIQLPQPVRNAYANVIEAINPFWESNWDWVISGYKNLNFDGQAIDIPETRMSKTVTLDAFEEIIASWTSFSRAIQSGVDIPEPKTSQAGIADDIVFEVSWPVLGKIFRK